MKGGRSKADSRNNDNKYASKAGGDMWKSMSEAQKAPFVAKAEKRRNKYNKNIVAYNKRLVSFLRKMMIGNLTRKG
ncbi:hypothetical protein SADUNF_Sadunf07G0056800 [Salix dunnii]|uniref:HMG box domain-containing protein n=1 Tax=Salix dunnii TaxID=1413687 RepID=A0A835MV80_9ROSI|nr:hypothetical protein SADUNF_Sadunf07G0056800 [Salix dunnii]